MCSTEEECSDPAQYGGGSHSLRGILVLRHGDTTRYLGYQVGRGDLEGANWDLRIRYIKKRLGTAATISTSVAVRILL